MAATRETRENRLSIAGLAVAAIFFLAINAFAAGAFRGWSLDFTAEGLFTLSDATRQVLEEIEEPVTLHFFYSPRIGEAAPQIGAYADRVREMVERYDEIAGPRIDLRVYNPEPFSDAEDLAVGFGLQGIPVDQGSEAYFGLAGTNSTDDEERIALFHPDREGYLEYDLTRMISVLANPEQKVLYLQSSLPVMGRRGSPVMQQGGVAPWQIMAQLQESYDIRRFDPEDGRVPADADLVMLIHPKQLSDRARYMIDQWVLGGGKLIAFADPHAEAEQGQAAMVPGQTGSNLPGLFEAWGFRMDSENVVGDANAAIRVLVQAAGRRQEVDYLAWLGLEGSQIADDPLTADIEVVNMGTAGHLTPVEGATTEMTPLLTSSEQSALIRALEVAFMADPSKLWEEFEPSGRRFTLAARVTGPAKTAFPDGPPPPPEEEDGAEETSAAEDEAADDEAQAEDRPAHIAEGEIAVLVVADTDILRDQFWVQRRNVLGREMIEEVAGNGAFVNNAVDSFAGDAALIGLRTRGTTQRPFTLVRELERRAEAEYRSTEQELRAELDATQKKLDELQTDVGEGGDVILTDEQRQAIDNFTAEVLQIRKQLRDVQRKLHEDIERLEGWLKFVNIALIPIVVALVAIGLALWQRRRRSRARTLGEG